MEEYAALCLSLGLDIHDLDLMDIYLLAGKIAEDRVLSEKSRARFAVLDAEFRSTPFSGRYAEAMELSSRAFREVVAGLTAQEKREVRERVLGVVPITATRNTEPKS